MMTDAVLQALYAFRSERKGEYPTSLRLHPEDWTKLRSECRGGDGFLSASPMKFAGMTPLLDWKCPRGFPIALDAEGAAAAIENGARQSVN